MSFKTDEWAKPDADQTGIESPIACLDDVRKKRQEDGRRLREDIKRRLYSEGESELGNKLAKCGIPVPLVCTCCGLGKIVESRCKRRWCPACSYGIMRDRVARFSGAVKLMQWPMHLILTQPNSPDPNTIRDLRDRWGKMRRRKMMAEKISGGVASIEVTNRGNGWHAHLHTICDCRWLGIHTPEPTYADSADVKIQKYEHARLELSALWASVIKEPTAIVLAKRVADKSVAAYVLKYACKGSELIESPEPIGPLLRVMEKSRLISAYGNLHGRTQEMTDDEKPVMACTECGNEKSFMPLDVIDIMTRKDPLKNAVKVHFGVDFQKAAGSKIG